MGHTLEIALELSISKGPIVGLPISVLTAPVPDHICLHMTHHSHQEGHQLLVLLTFRGESTLLDVLDELGHERRPVGSLCLVSAPTGIAPIGEGTPGV